MAAEGGVRHEAIWRDRGARRDAGHVRRGADGSPGPGWPGPKWVFLSAEPLTLDPSFCGFKVRLTATVNKEFLKVLKTQDGSMTLLITGSGKSTITNLSTGKTITENVSGPSKTTVSADGSFVFAGKGHFIIFLAPADAQRFGLPTLFISAGAYTQSTAADGTITSASLNGHVALNLCTALS